MSLVGFKAQNHPQQPRKDSVDDRWTPLNLWIPWNDRWGFTLDAAASDDNPRALGARAADRRGRPPPRAETEARYFVPRSQVWEGSRGRQSGRVHLRRVGEARTLCGRGPGWYERPADDGEPRCSRCEAAATRHGLEWPA